MLSYQFVAIRSQQTLELQIGHLLLNPRKGTVDDVRLLFVAQLGKHAVDVQLLFLEESLCLLLFCRLYVCIAISNLHIFIIGDADTVIDLVQGVQVPTDLSDAFRLGIVGEGSCIHHVEVAIEIDDNRFMEERLAAIRNAGTSCQLLRPHVLKPFATP